MRSLNRLEIIGNLGADPETTTTQSGKKLARLSVATSEGDFTEWHRVTCWEGLAEVAEKYLKKGDRIFVAGPLRSREWEGEDGSKHGSAEIVARELVMLGGGQSGSEEALPY